MSNASSKNREKQGVRSMHFMKSLKHGDKEFFGIIDYDVMMLFELVEKHEKVIH